MKALSKLKKLEANHVKNSQCLHFKVQYMLVGEATGQVGIAEGPVTL